MVRPSTGGPSGPPQAHDRGSDSSRSPRNRLRLAMPSANSAENPAMTRSGRPSLSELYPRASRPWMSSRSSCMATVASQQREPVPDLPGAHVAPQAGPDLGVVLDVFRAEGGIGRIPHRHGHLASAQDVFERLLVRGSAPEQPAGR